MNVENWLLVVKKLYLDSLSYDFWLKTINLIKTWLLSHHWALKT